MTKYSFKSLFFKVKESTPCVIINYKSRYTIIFSDRKYNNKQAKLCGLAILIFPLFVISNFNIELIIIDSSQFDFFRFTKSIKDQFPIDHTNLYVPYTFNGDKFYL